LLKNRQKRLKLLLKEKMDTESLQKCKRGQFAGEKGGYWGCQAGN